jgi:hypothetical protein
MAYFKLAFLHFAALRFTALPQAMGAFFVAIKLQ